MIEEGVGGRARSGFWHRFLHQPFAVGGLAFLLLVIVAAIFAPLIAPYPPNLQNLDIVNAGPSAAHWLGTDDLGRDILSRLIWGARVSLRATFEIVGIAILFAAPLGLIAGFFRGGVDSVIMRAMDAMFSFPPLILALTVAALLGASINDTAIAIAIVFIPSFVRLLRGEVIAVREENYIEAARSLGATSNRLIRRHVMPNVASPIIIQIALSLGFALLVEAGLSYLGLGEQPPTPSWGSMLNEGYQFIFTTPWALVFPGLAIMLSVLCFNLVADGLRDSLGRERPKSSSSRQQRCRQAPLARDPLARDHPPGRPSDRCRGRRPRCGDRRRADVQPARGQGPPYRVPDQRPVVPGDGRCELHRRTGKDVGAGRRERVGQDGLGPGDHGPPAPRGARANGSARFEGRDLMRLSRADFRQIRGNEIAMIFQEPMTSLNPAYTVGNQIAEQVRTHRHLSKAESWKVAVEMLERVEIPNAATRARDYPHAFSGGMRQRVMIAMALSCSPKLLIADEPTTALDVTTQAQIVELLHTLQREEDMAMIFVTHDLGVIADVADDVVVMYAGQIVEQTDSTALFTQPRHPYTEALLNSIPQLTPAGEPLHFIPGIVPRPDQVPSGCRFNPRCDYAVEACVTHTRRAASSGRRVRWTSEPRPPVTLRRAASQVVPLSRCLRQDELTLVGARARGRARHDIWRRDLDRARTDPGGQGTVEAIPAPQRGPATSVGIGQRRGRRGLLHRARHDARVGRREWLGEVHARPPRHPSHRADGRKRRPRRNGHHRLARAQAATGTPADADGLPGPVLVSRPAPEHPGDRRRAPEDPHLHDG